MSWTLLVFVFGIQGAYPTSQVVGNYSSLNVCRTEKELLRQELLNQPPAADPTQTTKFYFILACARRT